MRWTIVGIVAVSVATLALVGCGGSDESEVVDTSNGNVASEAHLPLESKTSQPKHLEAVIEIDMNEMYFANPKGEKNPTFTLPAGKTVGIHIHNEGSVVHELMIGRKLATEHGYSENLNELVRADLFFYYGDVKAEVEGAVFEELEVDPGIRDVWLRMDIPANMAGEWEIGCFVEGHYEAGMHTTLVIQ